MNNYVQTFTGFEIPPNHIVRFQCVDTGQNGIYNFGITYLQNDKIKNFHQSIDASEYATDEFNLDVDLYDSKVLSITCYVSGQRSVNVNRRINVFLVNQQGRGAATIVGLITQQDVSQYHPLSWPFNGNVNNFTPYGVPVSREMTISGNKATFTVPENWIFRLCSLNVLLDTDGTVVDRRVSLFVTENAIVVGAVRNDNFYPANTFSRISFGRYYNDVALSSGDIYTTGCPDFVVNAGALFDIIIGSFQAGDSIDHAAILGEYIYNG